MIFFHVASEMESGKHLVTQHVMLCSSNAVEKATREWCGGGRDKGWV